MYSVKIHKSYRTVVALCDSNLVGKKFEEGEKQLDLRASFYQGEEKDKSDILDLLRFQQREDATFNIVGPNSIKAALEAEIITEEGIAEISGIPYALVLL